MPMSNHVNNITVYQGYSTEEMDNKTVIKKIAEQVPIVNTAIESSKEKGTYSSMIGGGLRDPLDIIDNILNSYAASQMDAAEAMADSISVKSNAIAEINRIFGLIMQELISLTDPNDPDVRIELDRFGQAELNAIDKLIKEDLGDPDGIKEITGYELKFTVNLRVSYSDLQSMNATMTAYCDTIQVDLDSLQTDFKNKMTEVTSAQEEVTSLRQFITNISKS